MRTPLEDIASANEQQVVFQPSIFNCGLIFGEGVKWPKCALAHADCSVIPKHHVSYL